MIYLFCNNGYGKAFLREFMTYSRIRNSQKCIVFSNYEGKPVNIASSPSFEALRRVKRSFLSFIHGIALTGRYRIRVLYAMNVNSASFYTKIRRGDHGIICGFNQIFSKNVIERFDSIVNFHPSLLPLYRGPVPSYWCIKNQERYSGFTLHRVSPEIDKGEILYQGGIVKISDITDPTILDAEIAQRGSKVLVQYLDDIMGYQPLVRIIVEATEFYKCRVDYASFPIE